MVAALDFPFSVPQDFAEFWKPDARDMSDMWAAASGMELADFLELRQGFIAQRGYPQHSGPKRQGDIHHKGCYSPLHRVNPVMTHMTFYGMQMLHALWPLGFCVPPLPQVGDDSDSWTLLEVMPGAVLKHLGLPSKGYKNGMDAPALRNRIWEGLPTKSGLNLVDAERFKEDAFKNDDCLDSIVATVGAAIWNRSPARFRCQPEDSDSVARLEGWLYALDCDRPELHPQP